MILFCKCHAPTVTGPSAALPDPLPRSTLQPVYTLPVPVYLQPRERDDTTRVQQVAAPSSSSLR
ncbi:hypothetical protein JYU34_012376 [Plutella xylostella]|uniref:Uncharacterized protein n=1 Tax=Plutella xylostella TaxID=51655 RepID=A0ABQ7QEU9_PLUXY|nr:hypothetical protein JYU34_012376 [Plutella xylostella]